jgi:hypothetical protein
LLLASKEEAANKLIGDLQVQKGMGRRMRNEKGRKFGETVA